MKSQEHTKNIWAASRLVHESPIPSGCIPWSKLKTRQIEKFTTAFVANDALTARVEAFKRTEGDRHVLADYLHEYQKEVRSPDETRSQAKERYLRSLIELNLWLMLTSGDWKGFKWLAEYGEKHCQAWIEPQETPSLWKSKIDWDIKHRGIKSGRPAFPSPKERLKSVDETGWLLAAQILRCFADLAGLEITSLCCIPPLETPPPPFDGTLSSTIKSLEHQRTTRRTLSGMTPNYLPSKLTLYQRVTGDDSENISKHFSSQLTKVGLGGLPDARGRNRLRKEPS
jgi:hypothetical protein